VQGALCLFFARNRARASNPSTASFELGGRLRAARRGCCFVRDGIGRRRGPARYQSRRRHHARARSASAQSPSMPEAQLPWGGRSPAVADAIGQELVRLSRAPYVTSDDPSEPTSSMTTRRAFAGSSTPCARRVASTSRDTRDRAFSGACTPHGDRPNRFSERVREYVPKESGEADALGRDLLVHVTSFFRDGATYEALKDRILPEMLRKKQPAAPCEFGCQVARPARRPTRSPSVCSRRSAHHRIWRSDLRHRCR